MLTWYRYIIQVNLLFSHSMLIFKRWSQTSRQGVLLQLKEALQLSRLQAPGSWQFRGKWESNEAQNHWLMFAILKS